MLKKLFLQFTAFFLLILCVTNTKAAPAATNLLSNAGFESTFTSSPTDWHLYQWGSTGSKFKSFREEKAGRSDSVALLAENIDDSAKAGVYTHVALKPGTYELSVWARAAKGQTARARIYLATTYSRTFLLTDQWKQISVSTTLSNPTDSAEINIQNSSGEANVVWFDDAMLREVPGVHYEPAKDTRKVRPRTLLFSPINVAYLHDSAAEWAKHGFRGFLFDNIMYNWQSDVWATDGDTKTRGVDDKLLQEVLSCNVACRKVGIDSNFVKVSLNVDLPDPFDDAAWQKITENFRQGARFAKLSESAGIAIDTEYIAEQYNPNWEGYAKNPHPLPELKAKIHQRWHDVTAAMLQEYPQMVLLTLPEGMNYYGELYQDIFNGMLDAMSEATAPGGMHVMTEGTYHVTDPGGLATYAKELQSTIEDITQPASYSYWKQHCSIVLGAWPLGYYRAITDKDGKFVGWSGRKETFGDKIVGSYADKSAWYSPEVFAQQMTGLNSFSPRYNWIYGHGDVFTYLTPEQIAHYKSISSQRLFSVQIPVVPDIEKYFQDIANPGFVRLEKPTQ